MKSAAFLRGANYLINTLDSTYYTLAKGIGTITAAESSNDTKAVKYRLFSSFSQSVGFAGSYLS